MKNQYLFRLLFLLLSLAGLGSQLHLQAQAIRYVKPTATGTGSGDSWTNASGDLQAMINASGSGQQVWVAAGTYTPTTTTGPDSRTISFAMKNGVTIYGGFAGTESSLSNRPAVNPTTGSPSSSTLSGEIGNPASTTDNSYHVINNSTGLTTTAGLDGFVITSGNANASFPNNIGGGMLNRSNSSPTLVNCVFQDNLALSGGGMYNGNTSNPVLINCIFQRNSSINSAGGISNEVNSSPTLTNCILRNNISLAGGGMFDGDNCDPVLTNCVFQGNSANQGGAIANNQGSPTLINCLLLNNTATTRGGGIFNTNPGTNPTLINCTLRGNSSMIGGAISEVSSASTLLNCVLFDNGGSNTISLESTGTCLANYSLFEPSEVNYTGSNNLTTTVSPFVSTTSAALNGCSPAINAGLTSATGLIGITTDLAGNPRVFGGTVDMGAYEFQAAPATITVANPSTTSATTSMAFSQTFTASGGTAPYGYTIGSGSLPTGLSLATTGVLSGTPSQGGSFTIVVRAIDASGCFDLGSNYVLTVNATPTIAGLAASPNSVCAGSPTTFTATIGNVTGTYTFTLTNGSSTLITGSKSSSSFSQVITTSGTGLQTFMLTVNNGGQLTTATISLTLSNSPDYQPLVDLYNATNGANWTRKAGWLNGCDPCTGNNGGAWYGVTCTNGRVTHILLDENNLVGTIPASLSTLTNLESLELYVNRLSGSIPASLSALTNLRTLTLHGNTLTGSIPASLSALTNLESLALYANQLSGIIPTNLSTSLQSIQLYDNTLTGTIPASFSTLTNLRNLELQNNTLTGSIPASFSALTNLQTLNVSVNQLSGTIPASLSALTNLRTLALQSNTLTGSIPTSFSALTNLESLALYSNQLSGIIPTNLSTSLQSIQLNGNTLTGTIPASFSTLTNLRNLELQNNTLTGSIPASFSALTNLQNLNVSYNQLSGSIPSSLGLLTGIQTLNAFNNGLSGCFPASLSALCGGGRSIIFGANPGLPGSGNFTAFCQPLSATAGATSTQVTVGGTVRLNASGGAYYSWSGPNNFTASTANPSFAATSTAQSGLYSVTISNGACDVTATASVSVTVLSNAPTVTNFAAIDNKVCAGSLLTFTAAIGNVSPPYTYTLTNGTSTTMGTTSTTALTLTLTASGSGIQSFSLTARDNSLSTTSIISVTVDALPTASLVSSGTLTCAQTSVTLTASGGTSYTFSSGATPLGMSNLVMVTTPGMYSVSVGDVNGCVSTTSTTVLSNTALPSLSITPASATLTCASPSVSLTAVGLGSVLWSTGATTSVLPVSTAGTYSVTLTNGSGCVATASVVITSSTAVPSLSITPASATLTCASPSVSLTAVGVGSVLWNTGATTSVLPVSTAGTYSVTLTNGSGCVATASAVITSSTAVPSLSITPASAILTCASPSVSLTAVGVGSVLWSTGATTPIITVSTAGTYSVTLTNASGCVATASVVISANQAVPFLSITPASATLTCASPSVSLTAVGVGSVLWSTGATTPSVTVNTAGTYSVTLTNGSGCVATASVMVTNSTAVPSLSISPSSTTLTCATPSVSLTAVGVGSVLWSTGATTSVLPVSTAGMYSVTLTNGSGCTATASVVISADQAVPSLSISPSSATLTCASPSVSLTAVGVGSVLWSTGATTPSVTVSTAGTYSVTLTNGSGCTAMASVVISANQAVPSLSISPASATLTCASPSVSLTALGVGSVLWSNGATTSVLSVSTAGTYSVTLTNGSGCVATASVVVSADQAVPSLSITPASATLTCASPSVSLTALGVGSVLWSNGATTSVLSVSTAGTYSVTLTNGSGCVATASVMVTNSTAVPSLSISPSSTTLTCASPSVSLTAVGVGSVLWSTGATTPIITVSTAGTYSVTLTNASGCVATASVVITSSTAVPSLSITPASATLTCASPSVSLTAVGLGSVLWSTGATTSVLPVSTAGAYSVTLTNGSGCVATASVVISANQAVPFLSISPASATLTCASPSMSLTAVGVGSVLWSTGATTPSVTVNTAGTYSVTLTNGSGCVATASVVITSSTAVLSLSITPASATLTCASPSVSLTAVGVGSVLWSNGATTSVLPVSTAGTYSVTLTNASGCVAAASVMVTNSTAVPSLSILTNPSLTVAQGQSVTLTASATGAAPLAYTWSTLQITPSISVSTAATYSVTVTAANGCSATASVTVSVTAAPVMSGPFAITAVTTVDCTPILPGRYSISFTPRYSGLNGQPVSFSIANELLPTIVSGPYTLQLYTDNPLLTLRATQAGNPPIQASFSYNWLAACQASVSTNTPPRVVMAVGPQSATVGVGFSYVIPAGTFTDDQTPGSLVLTAAGLPLGLSLSGYTISGTPSNTAGSPFSVTITATDPGGLSVSTILVLTVSAGPAGPPVSSGVFSITGVNLLRCTPVADRINISFVPQYGGLNGQAIAFGVVNELAPTTDLAPYSLTLYRDNPVIRLRASQTGSVGEASFDYNWLVACASMGSDNTAPRVVSSVGNQTAVVGVGYNLNLSNVFADQETPTGLVLTASGLSAGLSLVGTSISGTPSVSGVSSVTLTATDPGGLSGSTSFNLEVSSASSQTASPPSGFAITGVQTVSCAVVSAGLRRVTFTPQYAGLTGQPISFRVVNELAATTNAGPYSLNLYTDNPVITLKATQGGSVGESSYTYNWLSVCGAGSRLSTEPVESLQVAVLGNPVVGETVEVEVRGASGQLLQVQVVDGMGRRVSETYRKEAGLVERLKLRLGQAPGLYLLQVSIPGQSQTVKIMKE